MIRPYVPSDCEALLEVWSRATAVAHPFLDSGFLDAERQAIPAVYLPVAETSVWEAKGNVVGFISLLGSEIGAIFVDPDFHRRGIGRALVCHARVSRHVLEVEVFERNMHGRAFYSGLGFALLRRAVHEQTGFCILRLRLPADAGEDFQVDVGK